MTTKHPTWLMPIGDKGAGLIMMPCPGTQETSLKETVAQLKEQGVTAILSMMTHQEMKDLGADSLSSECQKNNISWFDMETDDHKVPGADALLKWEKDKDNLISTITQGGTVAIHCKGGTGRTGVGAAMLLLELGWDADNAIADIQTLKPKAFSHELTVAFIKNRAKSLAK